MTQDGLSLFNKYYAEIYKDRWFSLQESLKKPEKQVLRENRFSTKLESSRRFQNLTRLSQFVHWRPQDDSSEWGPQRGADGLLDAYVMDPASIAPAQALNVQPGERVLDLCAAPGGKSLILAEDLLLQAGSDAQLILNDLSPDRRERLKKVLQQYIPKEIREDRIFLNGKDGVQFGLQQAESFDRILLDAPCSGERHLFENAEELADWTVRRSERLSTRQYSLLCSAWLALKPGGRIVYSTCALSPLENDEVIRKFLKKKKPDLIHGSSELPIIKSLFELSEPTEFGWQFLPDSSGIGPIYFSVLEKPK